MNPSAPTIPHNREAEEATIGSVLIDPFALNTLAFLNPADFFIIRHRWIWEAFLSLKEKGLEIDLVTVSDEMERAGNLAEAGGPAYLTSLVNQVPSALNAENYGRVVQEYSVRRKMIDAANETAKLAYDTETNIVTAHAEARRRLDAAYNGNEADFDTIHDLIAQDYDRIDARARGEDEEVIPTGFYDLDALMDGGMRGGNLILWAGRPGMGKTAGMLDIALYAAFTHKKRVATFSLEMSNEQITRRLICKFGISMSSVRTGRLKETEWPLYTNAVDALAQTEIFMNDISDIMPNQIRAKCHGLKSRHGLDLVIVDYIGLMGNGEGENRNQELSYISRELKKTARELNVPFLVGAQLNREIEKRSDKRPVLSDLRDSGSLEQDADAVIFLYRPNEADKDKPRQEISLLLEKQRDGKVGAIPLIFNGPLMKFENAVQKSVNINEELALYAQSAQVGSED